MARGKRCDEWRQRLLLDACARDLFVSRQTFVFHFSSISPFYFKGAIESAGIGPAREPDMRELILALPQAPARSLM
jgi:hypothetical protein